MKKIITAIAISFVMLLNSAIAESGHTGHCDSFGNLARVVMEVRQTGTPFSRHLGVAIKIDNENGNKFNQYLVTKAHSYPEMLDPEHQKEVVKQFSNEIYNECVNNRKSRGLSW